MFREMTNSKSFCVNVASHIEYHLAIANTRIETTKNAPIDSSAFGDPDDTPVVKRASIIKPSAAQPSFAHTAMANKTSSTLDTVPMTGANENRMAHTVTNANIERR